MEVEVSSDGMQAYLVPDQGVSGQSPDALLDDFRTALKSAGVVKGVDEKTLRSLAEALVAGAPCESRAKVAEGRPAVDGIDGRLGFRFQVDGAYPRLTPDQGKAPVPTRLPRSRELVRSGTVLAQAALPKPPIDGYTVLGAALKGKPATEIKIKTGSGVRRLDDGVTYVVADGVVGYVNCVNATLVVENPVTVFPDGMEATLTLYPASSDGTVPLWPDVEYWLQQQGVVHGLCGEALADAIIHAKMPNAPVQEIVVAKATAPVHGTNASIEILFRNLPIAGDHTERDDRVDYHERDFLHRVRSGELLARKTPATEGVPGSDVRGRPLPATDGRDARLEASGHAALSDDGLECHAAADGVAVVVNGAKVGVFEEYDVPGDVDLKTGNLHMNGSLTIRGWVRDGFKVSATGNLVIQGGVEPSQLETQGNLLVQGGVIGANRGTIKGGGDVSAQFLENTRLETGGDLLVRDCIVNSDVTVDGAVTVGGNGRGSIVGGVVRAGQGLQTETLGSRGAVQTMIDVGFDRETRRTLAAMARDCALYERNQQKIGKALASAGHSLASRRLGQDQTQAFARLAQYRRDIETKKRAIAEYWKRLDNTEAKIIAAKSIHDGTTVVLYGRRLDIREDLPVGGEFALDTQGGQVTYTPQTRQR